jgi:hypothetical protein
MLGDTFHYGGHQSVCSFLNIRDLAELIGGADVTAKTHPLPSFSLSISRRMTLLACGVLAGSESSASLR